MQDEQPFVKRIAKRWTPTNFHPLLSRIYKRVMRRNPILRHRVASLEQTVRNLNDHLPILLNVISSSNALTREAKRTEIRIQQRLDALSQQVADLQIIVSTLATALQSIQEWKEGIGSKEAARRLSDGTAMSENRRDHLRR